MKRVSRIGTRVDEGPGEGPPVDWITIGTCDRCSVAFLARLEDRGAVAELLRVHGNICPGGERAGEWAAPLETPAAGSFPRRSTAS